MLPGELIVGVHEPLLLNFKSVRMCKLCAGWYLGNVSCSQPPSLVQYPESTFCLLCLRFSLKLFECLVCIWRRKVAPPSKLPLDFPPFSSLAACVSKYLKTWTNPRTQSWNLFSQLVREEILGGSTNTYTCWWWCQWIIRQL